MNITAARQALREALFPPESIFPQRLPCTDVNDVYAVVEDRLLRLDDETLWVRSAGEMLVGVMLQGQAIRVIDEL